MIVDSSALIAVLCREPLCERLLRVMESANSLSLGAPTLVESGIVIGSRVGFPQRDLQQLIAHFEMAIIPFEPLHAEEALRAFDKFGKGRHKAALNYGDCLTYAIARLSGNPLLCIGEDFRQTDLLLVNY